VLNFEIMSIEIVKRPGADWDVYYMDLDGSRECMSVFGCPTPEEAIAEARSSLNALSESDEERDQFEILAVVRKGVDLNL
jgi:hypothetical protein